MPAGETLVEVGLKVVNYGTDRTPCPECEVRVTNTTLDLGAWWRVTWGGYLAMNSSYCAGQEHQTERNRECFPMPTLVPGSGWVGHLPLIHSVRAKTHPGTAAFGSAGSRFQRRRSRFADRPRLTVITLNCSKQVSSVKHRCW